MIKQQILKESFHEISHDTKFIRLATITTFIHSVIFLIYMAYITANVLTKGGENQVVNFFLDTLGLSNGVSVTRLIIVGIVLLIGYGVLPPIGEGAMIYYLNNPKKQGTLSLGKGMTRFLQMVEFDAAISFFSVAVILIAISRFYIMDVLGNGLVLALLSIWFIIIVLAAFLLPYSRYFIVLKQYNFFEAMKASMTMSIEHFAVTFRFIVVDAILHIRFVINIIIILGLPLGLMYLANWLGIADNSILQTVFILLVIALFLITAYINGIIEAFFTTYRYKLYKHVLAEESDTQAAIDSADKSTELATPEQQSAKIPQQVIINQYVVPPHAGQPSTTPQQPRQQYVVPEHEYTVPPSSSGQVPQPISSPAKSLEQIPGAQKIPAPDGGHFVYVPPQPEQPAPAPSADSPAPTPEKVPDLRTYTQQVLDGTDEPDTSQEKKKDQDDEQDW